MTDFAQNADNDRALLRNYAETGAQGSFEHLVRRYSGLVYGTAMRKTGNAEWAADVTQNVFAALAMKSEDLVRVKVRSVGAWLHRATTFESKRHMRDQLNAKRHHAMIAENLALQSDLHDRESAWIEIRPALDEALEKLPARDRDILLLHYFDGLKFREIAEQLGLRADAAQKRGARAVEKLSRLLRMRSGLASATILAAGLSAELARSAPASLVSRITAVSTCTNSATLLATAMTAKQISTSTIVTALALFAASIGAGYFIGDQASPEGTLPPSNTASHSDTGRAAIASELLSNTSAPLAIADAKTPAEQFYESVKTYQTERARLNEQANAWQDAGRLPEDYRILLEAMEGAQAKAKQAARKLSENDLAAAAAFFQTVGDDIAHRGMGLLFNRWAESDPHEALAQAESKGPNWFDSVMTGWGSADPQAALKYQEGLSTDHPEKGRRALKGIYNGWVREDPAAAVNAFEALDLDDQKVVESVFEDVVTLESKRDALLDSIAKVKNERLRASMVGDIALEWTEFAPEDTMAWFSTLEFENPRLRFMAAGEIFEDVVRRVEIDTAVQWAWPMVPPEAKSKFIEEFVQGGWLQDDKEAAEQWMKANGFETSRKKGTGE
jgi:RNA polymerase sigma factor (sigma-70 family)